MGHKELQGGVALKVPHSWRGGQPLEVEDVDETESTSSKLRKLTSYEKNCAVGTF